MRIFPVAQVHYLLERKGQLLGVSPLLSRALPQEGCDRGIVSCSMGEGLPSELATVIRRNALAGPQLFQYLAVAVRTDNNEDVPVVLGGGAHQGGAADVDLFYGLLQGNAGPDQIGRASCR